MMGSLWINSVWCKQVVFEASKRAVLSRNFDFSVKPFGKVGRHFANLQIDEILYIVWFMTAFHGFVMCWNKLFELERKIHRFSHLPDKRAIKAQAKWLHIFLQWLTKNTEATIIDLVSLKGSIFFPVCLGCLNMRETARHKLTGKHPGMFTPCDEAWCRYPWAKCKQVICSAEPHGSTTSGSEAVPCICTVLHFS